MKNTRTVALCAVLLAPVTASAADATLTWDVPPDAEMVTGWKLYYDRDQAGPPYDGMDADEGSSPIDVPRASVADPSSPSLVVSGLESCQSYWFAATAYNEAGESDFSTEVEKKVVAKPRNVMAVSEAIGEVRLSWEGAPADDPGTIPGYQVFYDLDASGEPYNAPGSPFAVAGVTEVNLTGLTTRATYYFVVDSVCENFGSNRSEEVSAQVIAELPMEEPNPVPNNPAPNNPAPDPLEMDEPTDEAVVDDGCACTVASRSDGPGWLLLLAVAVGVRRRKLASERF